MTITERNELVGKLVDLCKTTIREDETIASKNNNFEELHKINKVYKSIYVILKYLANLECR